MDNRKVRMSNLELLRIIAIIMITFNHITYIYEDDSWNLISGINKYLTDFFHMGGKFGVNLFLFIGCWFLSGGGGKGNLSRIERIVKETLFYGLFLNIIDIFIFKDVISIDSFFKGLKYWYPFGYVVMLADIPVLSRIAGKMKFIIVIVGSVLFSLVTMIGIVNVDARLIWVFDKGLFIGPVYFSYVYIFVSWIRERGILNRRMYRNYWNLLGAGGTYLLMYILYELFGSKWIRHMISPLCFVSALLFFIFFMNLNIPYQKEVNKLAECSFAVYLIQTHSNLRILQRFNFQGYSQKVSYFFLCCLVVLFIYILGVFFEAIRKQMIKGCSMVFGLFRKTG